MVHCTRVKHGPETPHSWARVVRTQWFVGPFRFFWNSYHAGAVGRRWFGVELGSVFLGVVRRMP